MHVLEKLKQLLKRGRRDDAEDEPAERPDSMTVDNAPFWAPTGYVKTYDEDRPRH